MKDLYGRTISYLRISLTDLCSCRCIYCMPQNGIFKKSHHEILSFEEIETIVRAGSGLGITKLRLTGGEPLVRRGAADLVEKLSLIPGITELALTTNGLLLKSMACDLRAAGLHRVNISLDSLNPETYRHITGGAELRSAAEGIEAAFWAGLTPVKLNVVLMGGINDGEIPDFIALTEKYPLEIRFIELMPIGNARKLPKEAYLPCSTVLEMCPELVPVSGAEPDSVAELYTLPGAPGKIGLIRPLSCSFCGTCSRLRLTADGFLKPCLHSKTEIPVRGFEGEALRQQFLLAAAAKPKEHDRLSSDEWSHSARCMNEIGG